MKACVVFIIFFITFVYCTQEQPYYVKLVEALSQVNRTDLRSTNDEYSTKNQPRATSCPSLPTPPATDNVNSLKPGHIKVVLAMGDSITAGASAKDTNIFFGLHEYRGVSYCIGGDSGISTLPNILKKYNSAITGYSAGNVNINTDLSSIPKIGLNGAVSGAISSDMLGQAQWLVQKITSNANIDIQQDWKLLTIWIGSNNLCQVCNDETDNDANNFRNNLNSALNYLFSQLPRLFVNLVASPDISKLHTLTSDICPLAHLVACPCILTDAEQVSAEIEEYVNAAYEIADDFNSRISTTQRVVVQPFLKDTTFSRSLLSSADCFHPNANAHQYAAIALWNNLITPSSSKKTSLNIADTPICATADTLIEIN